VGFTLEKDAGEAFHWEPMKQLGFDFFSFHAQVVNKSRLENLIVGDYQVQMGQGLVLGGLFGIGKGGESVTAARRSNLGGLPYTSSDENRNLRGALATYRMSEKIHITGFYSNIKRDASIQYDSLENIVIGTLNSTGLHRNNTELQGRDVLNETNTGTVVSFKNRQMDVGWIWNTISFNSPLNRKPSPYNQFGFNSHINHNTSLYLNYNYNNFTFFNEIAKSLNGGFALISGLLGSVTSHLDVALLYRNYQRNFYTFYSNAFGESSTVQNESGIYWSWKYKWNKKYSFAGYLDFFRFPWLRYRNYAPAEGYEWLLRFNYNVHRNTTLYVQLKEESKPRNISNDESPLYSTAIGLKRNFLFSADVAVNPAVRLKTRVQMSSFRFANKTSRGFAIVQDVRWDVKKWGIVARYALFDTEDYDNRQYVYENDVWLAFTFPAYEGQGIRNYLLLSYKLNRSVSAWIRFSHVRYTDRETMGSGYDLINGNQRNDIKFQLKIVL
jgi:hypothetical protein